MNNAISYILGVASGLTVVILVAIIVHIRTRTILNWSQFKHFWKLSRRLVEAGVANVFASRADYVRYRREASMSEYIATTKHELIYVGFWLAQGNEIDNIQETFKSLLKRDCTVILILLSPEIEPVFLAKMADYLGISQESLTVRLQQTWDDLERFRELLPGQQASKFILSKHEELTTSSVFIFDLGTVAAKTLVDFKFYHAGRANSFGIELAPSAAKNSLYDRITDSFVRIKNMSLSQ